MALGGARRRLGAGFPLARRAFALLRPQRRLLALAAVFTLVQALLALVPLILFKVLIDRLQDGDVRLSRMVWLVAGTVVVAAVLALNGVVLSYLQARTTEQVVCDLRDQLFGNFVSQPVGFWVRRRAGEVTSRILNDVAAVDNLLAGAVLAVLDATLRIVALTTLMFVFDWRLALAVCVVLPLSFIPVRRAAQRIGAARLRVQQQLADVTGYLQEVLSVSGAELVRAYGRRDAERERFASLNQELRRREVTAAMSSRWFDGSVQVITAIAPGILLLVGASLVARSETTTGTVLVVAFVIVAQLSAALKTVGGTLTGLLASVPVWKRIFEAVDHRPELVEAPDALKVARADVAGRIDVEDVTFTYPGQPSPALVDVSLHVPAGSFVAIVGPTGAGKSTLGALLARLADPQRGLVRLDGTDLRRLSFGSLAAATGIVFQETFLFHASLADNLRYARPEATDAELWQALAEARLRTRVEALSDGLDTIVGERGHKLSGGEKQRMAIARALLADPPVLILDEATSHLDAVVEREVQAALERLSARRTTVVIAHRLSTIRRADAIVVLDGGYVVAQGTHDELLAGGGLYGRLYAAQMAEDAIPVPPDAVST